MDLSPTSTSVRPSPSDRGTPSKNDNSADNSSQKGAGQAMGAAAAGQQPKIVQTAFIHKLYKCVPLFGLPAESTGLTVAAACLKTGRSNT